MSNDKRTQAHTRCSAREKVDDARKTPRSQEQRLHSRDYFIAALEGPSNRRDELEKVEFFQKKKEKKRKEKRVCGRRNIRRPITRGGSRKGKETKKKEIPELESHWNRPGKSCKMTLSVTCFQERIWKDVALHRKIWANRIPLTLTWHWKWIYPKFIMLSASFLLNNDNVRREEIQAFCNENQASIDWNSVMISSIRVSQTLERHGKCPKICPEALKVALNRIFEVEPLLSLFRLRGMYLQKKKLSNHQLKLGRCPFNTRVPSVPKRVQCPKTCSKVP